MVMEIDTDDMDELFRRRATTRLEPWFSFLNECGFQTIRLAGGGLRRKARDLDVFPAYRNQDWPPDPDEPIDEESEVFKEIASDYNVSVVGLTDNALTLVKDDAVTLQLCGYYHPSLEELVESFDFAHIQIGATVFLSEAEVYDLYYTEDFVRSQVQERTWYTGSDYPMSSLLRAFKYRERDLLPGNSHMRTVASIIPQIVDQQFDSYDDFREQLDAIDPFWAPREQRSLEDDPVLRNLYNALS